MWLSMGFSEARLGDEGQTLTSTCSFLYTLLWDVWRSRAQGLCVGLGPATESPWVVGEAGV